MGGRGVLPRMGCVRLLPLTLRPLPLHAPFFTPPNPPSQRWLPSWVCPSG